ncbi:MAG: SGNH/GDSL hydrolase family protein [Acidobacteriota bacterium]
MDSSEPQNPPHAANEVQRQRGRTDAEPADYRFPRAFYVLAPLLSLAVSLAVIEAALRWVFPVPFAAESNMYYEPDPHTGFRLKPNSVGQFVGGLSAAVNRHGHRDAEVPVTKPAGEYRILTLGDSFTMGANVPQPAIYTEVLEDLLRQEIGGPIEVVNTGVGGWGPFQYAQYYEYYGRRFDPDLILVGFFVGNDAFSPARSTDEVLTAVRGRRVRPTERERPQLELKIWLYAHSGLARLYFNRHLLTLTERQLRPRQERRLKGGPERDSASFTERYLGVQRKRLQRIHRRENEETRRQNRNAVAQIGRIQTLAEKDAIPLLVVLIPDENQVNRSLFEALVDTAQRDLYDLAMPQKLLHRMFAEQPIETLDLLPSFLADERRLYMNDTHWNEAGHRLAAGRIFDHIAPRVRRLAAAS